MSLKDIQYYEKLFEFDSELKVDDIVHYTKLKNSIKNNTPESEKEVTDEIKNKKKITEKVKKNESLYSTIYNLYIRILICIGLI